MLAEASLQNLKDSNNNACSYACRPITHLIPLESFSSFQIFNILIPNQTTFFFYHTHMFIWVLHYEWPYSLNCFCSSPSQILTRFHIYVQVKHKIGVEDIVNHVLQAWEAATGKKRHWHFLLCCIFSSMLQQ